MDILKLMDANIISFIILAMIYTDAYRRTDRTLYHNKIFFLLLKLNMVMTVIDILSWTFNNKPGQINYLLNILFNCLLFVIAPFILALWLHYVSYHIYRDEAHIKKWRPVFFVLLPAITAVSIASIKMGWFFYVDINNLYFRGTFYWFYVIGIYLMLSFSVYETIINKKNLERGVFLSLLQFPIFPTVGSLIQAFYLGASYTWTGMMLSILIVYFNIQERTLNTDYLTGVYNRRQLDNYINSMIKNSSSSHTFSALLLDINNFKEINDKYGHDKGDEAIQEAVKIIRKSLCQNDFVARYGGDEFFIITDIQDFDILEQTVQRIRENAEFFNSDNNHLYQLSFSIGYDVVNVESKMNADDFFKHIDRLMYLDKSCFDKL